MAWVEVRLEPGSDPAKFYSSLTEGDAVRIHHFWDEPWWPGAYVVRIEHTELIADPLWWFGRSLAGVHHVVTWDPSDDEKLYGQKWDLVADFFERSSRLAAGESPNETLKLVHCLLNARGMSERDEARFAWTLLWNRLLIKHRLRRYYQKQERRARRAQKAQVAT